MVTRTCAPLTSSMVWLARVRKATFHGCFTCIPRVQFSNSCAIAKWRPLQYGSHAAGGVGQGPGIAQYQHLNNCIPDIPIASPYVS